MLSDVADGSTPGLPPWGPHVRFRRVQTWVREGQSVGQAAQFCLVLDSFASTVTSGSAAMTAAPRSCCKASSCCWRGRHAIERLARDHLVSFRLPPPQRQPARRLRQIGRVADRDRPRADQLEQVEFPQRAFKPRADIWNLDRVDAGQPHRGALTARAVSDSKLGTSLNKVFFIKGCPQFDPSRCLNQRQLRSLIGFLGRLPRWLGSAFRGE